MLRLRPSMQLTWASPSASSLCSLRFSLLVLDCCRGFGAEDAVENRVHGAQLTLEIKCMREGLLIEELADIRICRHAVAETCLCLPGCHGMPLHPLVRVLARRSVLDQIL